MSACDSCGFTRCQCATVEEGAATRPAFVAVRMSDVPERPTRWVIKDLLPESDVVVLVGEEGIGKGLWWIEQARAITDAGGHVVLIVAEDDPHRALKPRMRAAGVDTDKVVILVEDAETMTGHPYLPTHTEEVEQVIRDTGARLLIIDPWVSVVPGHLSLKDTQQARAALDPLTRLARRAECCVLAVAHTNRSGGSTRDRVGLTAVLRQAARVLILALEEPEDEHELLVGIDKANNTGRHPAVRWGKDGQGDAWRLVLLESDSGASIRDWDARFHAGGDARTSDRWLEVVKASMSTGGMVTRAAILGIYGEDHAKAGDKAIGRWVGQGRLVRHDLGVFEVILSDPPAKPPAIPPAIPPEPTDPPMSDAGGRGAPTTTTPRFPHTGGGGYGGESGGDDLQHELDRLLTEHTNGKDTR